MFRGALATALLVLLVAPGCGSNCDQSDEDPVTYTEGTADATLSVYETSPWYGRWLHFPAGRRYQLVHHLGRAPYQYETFLSFHETQSTDSFNAAESAGNQAVVEDVNDEYIQLHNDTCAEFYLRLTATAMPQGPVTDAGTD